MSSTHPTRVHTGGGTTRRTYGTGSLFERADKLGNRSWYGKWQAGDQQVKRKLGPKRTPGSSDGLTKAQAERRLRELMAETAEEVRLAPKRTGRTLADVGEQYLAAKTLKASTAQDYRMHLRAHLIPHFGERRIDTIDAAAIEALIAALQDKGLKAKTVRTYVTTLSTLLNYAVRKRWLARSPMPEVDLPPLADTAATEPLRFLRVFEVHDLAAAAIPGPYEQVDRCLYVTASLTGLRQGELRGLPWECVDLVAQRVRVVHNIVRGRRTTPKSGKMRSVPLAPQVVAELEALREQSRWTRPTDPVFADFATGQPIARTPLMERYRKALTAAGLDEQFRFHDLRHTFGTSLAMAGVDVVTIQEYMGHSDLATTRRYLHYAPAADDAARIGRAFELADPRGTIRGTNLSAHPVPEAA